MANCIACEERYYLDTTGCTLRFCSQKCLRSYTTEQITPGWAGDVGEVFDERDQLRCDVFDLQETVHRFASIIKEGKAWNGVCAVRLQDAQSYSQVYQMSKIPKKMYLHGNKESLGETGRELGLDDDALDTFKRSLYEVEFDCILDTDTGEIEVKSIDLGDGELFTK